MQQVATSLASMRPGQRGIVVAVTCLDRDIQRLMSLGLIEGAEVEMAGAAIGGDPIELRLFGAGLSLRRDQARHFLVESKPAVD